MSQKVPPPAADADSSHSQCTCPQCKQKISTDFSNNKYFPFCSARCKTLDLGEWAMERYRIPSRQEDDSDEHFISPPTGHKDE